MTLYLWYDEIIDVDPANHTTVDYFDLMKTFATTPSGAPKDKAHFIAPTTAFLEQIESGITLGYGITFFIVNPFPPREVVVAYTQPNSPATSPSVNMIRGTRILTIDGVDFVFGSDVLTINAGLFPANVGETHQFTILDPGSSVSRSVTMTSTSIVSVPVQNVGTVTSESGPVGYILFNEHIETSEKQLIEAIEQLNSAQITDLVLDLRYNGGGLVDIANELAFMIAGPVASAGQTFVDTRFNDKHTLFDPFSGVLLSPTLFHTTALGFSAIQGETLPSLNLRRVFVLTSPNTCSASEMIINGLSGIDIEVIQIGSTTCGKPYGFYAVDNCGSTYFSIQIQGFNAKGFGQYGDGFSPSNIMQVDGAKLPGCTVADDFTHQLGDPAESRFAAALRYRADKSCPTAVGVGSERSARSNESSSLSAVEGTVVKPMFLQNWIEYR